MANKYVRTGEMVPCRDCSTFTYLQIAKIRRGDRPLCNQCKQSRASRSEQSKKNRLNICQSCNTRFYWHTKRYFCLSCTPRKSVGKQYNTSCVTCNRPFKARDPKSKKTCSDTCARQYVADRQRGELSHLWKGGLTNPDRIQRNSMEYADWRKAVFVRDDFTCQLCYERGGKLAAHHIREYAKHKDLRTHLGNGITLCWPCHRSIKRKERVHETTFYDITGGVK